MSTTISFANENAVWVKPPSAPPLLITLQKKENAYCFLIATIVDYKWLRELTSLKTHRKIPPQKMPVKVEFIPTSQS